MWQGFKLKPPYVRLAGRGFPDIICLICLIFICLPRTLAPRLDLNHRAEVG